MQNVSLSNIIINLLAYELNNILLFNSNGQVRKAIKDLIAAGFKPFGPETLFFLVRARDRCSLFDS